ncbi:hypothetical protein FSP39_009885 [Pinctada imbricata]|uniref:Uncharacterized protein n=1 Tax=Pinctada imbricata TaxID=66713 RepID=A0AA88XQX8_PINIB|nr:hypothetical protein FSP39_009885 [Pinctada imbricata]
MATSERQTDRKIPKPHEVLEMMRDLEGDVKIRTACLQKDINRKRNCEKKEDLEKECLALSDLIITLKEYKLIIEKYVMMIDIEKEVKMRDSHRERDSGIDSFHDNRLSEEQNEASGIQESCPPLSREEVCTTEDHRMLPDESLQEPLSVAAPTAKSQNTHAKNTEQIPTERDAKGTRNTNSQHRNMKHKRLHINQRDQWATGADLGRPSAMLIADGVVILDYVRTTLSLLHLPRGLEERTIVV